MDDFTQDTKNNFYINLTISLILTIIIALIILNIVKNYNKKLEQLAEHDTLTTLPNRRNFSDKLKQYILLNKRIHKPLSLVFIDIDNFKQINDSFGHAVGDEVLKEISRAIKINIRESDICARWGGEEFVIAFMNTELEDAEQIIDKIRSFLVDSPKLKTIVGDILTISAGLTKYIETDSIDSLISRADDAMYQAKNNGKNCIEIR